VALRIPQNKTTKGIKMAKVTITLEDVDGTHISVKMDSTPEIDLTNKESVTAAQIEALNFFLKLREHMKE
jgi:hypothetical protein